MCFKKVIEKKAKPYVKCFTRKTQPHVSDHENNKTTPNFFLCIIALNMEYYVVMAGSATQRSGIQATGPQKYGAQALVTEGDIKTWSVPRFGDHCDCLSVYINCISIPDNLLPARSRVGFIRHRPQMIYSFGLLR